MKQKVTKEMAERRAAKRARRTERSEEIFASGEAPNGGPIQDPAFPAWLIARGLDPIEYLFDFPYAPYDELPPYAAQYGITWLDIYEANALSACADDLHKVAS